MAHKMNEGVVTWAAGLARQALENLGAHDKETRRLLEVPLGQRGDIDWTARDETRRDLAAQVAETSRVLVKAVLG